MKSNTTAKTDKPVIYLEGFSDSANTIQVMTKKNHSFILILMLLIVAQNIFGNVNKSDSQSKRKLISLDGIWQIAEGGMEKIPEKFDREIIVPGLVDMAKPAFIEPGPKVAIPSTFFQKDPRRDAFWYRRTFTISEPISEIVLLRIRKAMYGTRVFLNGKLIGDHAPCFTQGFFDLKNAIKSGVNELIVRVGADRDAVSGLVESGQDIEKQRYIPGIYDNVELIMSGAPHILNVQAVPDIENKSVTVHTWIKSTGMPVKIHVIVREVISGKIAGVANCIIPANESGKNQTGNVSIPIKTCQLWSPEHPFLYDIELNSDADSYSTRFGMRSFHFDSASGRAILNGKPYFMRGTNVNILRFFEDSVRGNKPWDEKWVRSLFKKFKDMHWNSMRVCIGFAPEFWYRIADEEGFLIQDEYPIWYGSDFKPACFKADILASQFREWMEERWNHPCVVIWDACNETYSPETGKAIKQVRALDFSNRPWENGWSEPVAENDPAECHRYHFIFGPNQPFRMRDLANDDGGRDKILKARKNDKIKNPLIINEYGGLWLNRNGTSTTLSEKPLGYLTNPSTTVAQRRLLYARNMAALTEYFRAHRHLAGLMHFCSLGYSRNDGQTSDDWINVDSLTWEPDFYSYVRDAFAPIGIMLNFWEDVLPAGKIQQFPIIVYNDLEKSWQGEVLFKLKRANEVVFSQKLPIKVDGYGTTKINFNTTIPQQASDYQAEVTLIKTPCGSVSSLRDFSVLTPIQNDERRNFAQGKLVKASSVFKNDSTSHGGKLAVDNNLKTSWRPENGGNSQWLAVDLGTTQTISNVVLSWWWNLSPVSYLVQVSSDGDVWETVFSTSEKTYLSTCTSYFPSTQARWVRFFFVGNGNGNDKETAYSISDFAVYR